MAEAAAKDQSELVVHLASLSQNDHKILNALEDNHFRVEELLVALTKVCMVKILFLPRKLTSVKASSKYRTLIISYHDFTAIHATCG